MHGVQLGQVPLRVRVSVVQVDGGGGGVAGLRYHGSQRPGQLVNQVRADHHVLDQPARRPDSRRRHLQPAQERIQAVFMFRVKLILTRYREATLPSSGHLKNETWSLFVYHTSDVFIFVAFSIYLPLLCYVSILSLDLHHNFCLSKTI